jgi:hypothetical protein
MRTAHCLHVALFALVALAACSDNNATSGEDAGIDAGQSALDSAAALDSGGLDASQDSAVSTDGGLLDAGADARPTFVFKYADVNHVLGTGQSLSVGAVGTPVLSTTQPYLNVMFAGGVRPTNAQLGSFLKLVEGPTNETHNSAFANLITQLAETSVFLGQPAPGNSHKLLISIHGIGGTAYAGLKKGTAAYAAGIAQVTAAKALTANSGESYLVRAVTNVHGESDHIALNANYAQDLLEWQNDYDTDVRAITGQTERVPMLQTQMSSWTKYGQASSIIPMAQLNASTASNGAILLVGAKYHVQYTADGVHLTSEGYRHMGEYYAKVYRRVILEGKTWEPVRPKQVALTGDTIAVTFYVPEPPLVLDTTLVTNPGDFGFEYRDDSGAAMPTIAQVTLDGPATIKIKLSGVPTGQKRVLRYAMKAAATSSAGATSGPRGNLRDSDATPSRYGYKLYNWGVHFESAL